MKPSRAAALAGATWVAVLGAANRVAGDAASPIMIGYSQKDSTQPRYRFWQAGAWTAEQTVPNTQVEDFPWVILRNCPTRNEWALGTINWWSEATLAFYDGVSWTANTKVCSDIGVYDQRPFDLAYESVSGDLLVAYWIDSGANRQRIGYRTFGPGLLSSQQYLVLPNQDRVMWIQLYPIPGTDQILLLALNTTLDLYAAFWNGSGFSAVTMLHDNLQTASSQCFDAAFESLSGEGLVIYCSNGHHYPKYRRWNGITWSAEMELPSVGATQRWFRLVPDPASDKILMGCLDNAQDINVSLWNGNAWSAVQELETNACFSEVRTFDIAFEPQGTRALIAYPDNWNDKLRYRVWNGSAWSAEVWGPNLADDPTICGLFTGLVPGEIFVLCQVDGLSLKFMRWNGTALSAPEDLVTAVESWGTQGFMVAMPAAPRKRFVDVSSAAGFGLQTSSDPEWGSGLHWGDLNGDGRLDAIITGNGSSRLLLGNTSLTFSANTFGGGTVYRQGALLDIDNDGDLDFWGIPHWTEERLFLNSGAASFTDSGAAGFGDPYNNEGLAAADVNGDGWCDLVMFSANGNWIGHNQGTTPSTLLGTTAAALGLSTVGNYGNGDFCAAGDVNNDGRLDFFFHYDGGRLFVSNGDGAYRVDTGNIVVATGLYAKFGSAFGDYDNDGDLDLFAPSYTAGTPGSLWKNLLSETGSLSFVNVAAAAGITNAAGHRGCCWGDYDHDGDLDLYVVTRGGGANVLYQNQGPPNWTFTDVTLAEGAAAAGDGQDAVFVDCDNDGDLDLAVTQTAAANTLLRNRTDDQRYLKVRVLGRGGGGTNRAGVGVRVELWDAAGQTRLARRDLGTARGYGGTEPLWAHFGGVNPAMAYTIKVFFASRSADDPYSVSVVPATVSTTIGGTVIPQMLTVEEPPGLRIIRWREVPRTPASE
mgnify:CR=1 FL=1